MLNDLRCENGHTEFNVYYKDTPPVCPTCGGPRSRYWGSRVEQVGLFQPVFDEILGWIRTPEAWAERRKQIAEAQGCRVEDIIAHNEGRTARVTRGEEALHRAWERRKAQGLDSKQLREVHQETRRSGVNPLSGRRAR